MQRTLPTRALPHGGMVCYLRRSSRGFRLTPWACPFANAFTTRQPEVMPFLGAKERAGQPYRMSMGLQPMNWRDWFEIDEWYEEEIELKRRLLAEKRGLLHQMMPEALPACRELLNQLVDWLPRHYPDRFKLDNGSIYNVATGDRWDLQDPQLDPLFVASMLVQEDLLIVQDGRMIGGSVCFPIRWSVAHKMGLDMSTIHAPVPGFQDQLLRGVNAFMGNVKPERPFWRANWGIDTTPELSQPVGDHSAPAEASSHATEPHEVTPENAGEKLFLRVERQVLSRLPETRCVLFTVHTYIRPLQDVVRRKPEAAGDLAVELRKLPDDFAGYKGLLGFRESALQYLQRAAAPEVVA